METIKECWIYKVDFNFIYHTMSDSLFLKNTLESADQIFYDIKLTGLTVDTI